MTDTRDPRVAELVTRLVELAPPAPPFPDSVESPRVHTKRRAVLATLFFVSLPVVAVVLAILASRHDTATPARVAPSSTTTPTPTTPTTGQAVSPPLVDPWSVAVSADGTLYVGDTGAHRVVTISDGVARLVAKVQQPLGLAFGPDGLLYVADDGTHSVLRVERDGRVTTFAGNGKVGFSGDGGPATRAQLSDPVALTFGPDGALYIADAGNERVRRVAPDRTISTFAGNGSPSYTGDGGPALEAGLDPQELAFDGSGNLVVFQFDTKAIRRITPDGIITSVESRYASGLAARPDGGVAIADYGGFGLSLLSPGGTISNIPFEHAGLFRPTAIAVAANGDTYVADDGAGSGGPMRIMRVHPDGSSEDITPGSTSAPLTSTPNARTAAAAVPYVEGLAAQRKLPYAETIQAVRAQGDFMVLSTTLTDSTKAAEIWEALSLKVGCDDSHLLVRGYHVLLADGSVVAAPRQGFQACAGT
jgi:sugar lactone lactonase YvrE